MTSISRSGSSTSTTHRSSASAGGRGRARRWRPLAEALAKANVAAVAFDVLFSEKDQPSEDQKACAEATVHSADQGERCQERADGDVAFAHAISGRPVVLGTFFTATPNAAKTKLIPKGGFSFIGETPNSLLTHLNGALPPVPVLADAASGLGFLNWLPDDDRVVRTVPLLLDINGQIQPSLAMETLRVAQGASGYVVKSTDAYGGSSGKSTTVEAIKVGDVVVPTQGGGDLRVWFAKNDPRRSIPAWKALEPGADLSDLAGKLVFVGPSATMLSDVVATPLDPSTPGVQAHAQLVEQILSGVTLERPDWAPGAELVASAVLSLALAALLPFVPIYWTAFLGFAAAHAMAYVSWSAFTQHGVLFDPVIPSLSAGFVFLAGVGQLYGQKRQQVSEIRSAFGRYVSPAVVARLAEHPEHLQLGGQQRDLTLMFCDIRSFTTLSEGFTAVELSTFLNEYLSPMTDIILKQMGTVDKYMGDAIMAFWNAPLDDPAHGVHAVALCAPDARNADQAQRRMEGEGGEGRTPGSHSEIRHRPQHRRMQRRQHGVHPALRLFGARRRGQHRFPTRGLVQTVRRRHRCERGYARRGA